MLIEQIIKFQSRAWGPLAGHVFLRWLFSRQNKNLYGKSSTGVLFTTKIPYFPLPGTNRLQNPTPKCKILNAFWA